MQGMGTPHAGIGGVNPEGASEEELAMQNLLYQQQQQQQYADRSPSPVSIFRQYEMADTFRQLQNLAATRPCQGKEPTLVPLPPDTSFGAMYDPGTPTPYSSSAMHGFDTTQKPTPSVGSVSGGGPTSKRRSIAL
eukprot:TRINITY_DN4459_c0_g1_i2.p1 TRINITY_DN4459_c0_g1~~TRINITY_DN4459_c0_g1_i2.p1  ORF type:complete len:149 (+),score=26.25 TRINITY_DN4459_c0_g1_i2:45-449(+)